MACFEIASSVIWQIKETRLGNLGELKKNWLYCNNIVSLIEIAEQVHGSYCQFQYLHEETAKSI